MEWITSKDPWELIPGEDRGYEESQKAIELAKQLDEKMYQEILTMK